MPFLPEGPVAALDAGVLLWRPGADGWRGMPRFPARISSLPLMYSGRLSARMVPGRLRIARSAGFEPQVPFQRGIDVIDRFEVPGMAQHVAQMQQAPPEAPGLAGIGQPSHKLRDLLALVRFGLSRYHVARRPKASRSAQDRLCGALPLSRPSPGTEMAASLLPGASFSRSARMPRAAPIRFKRRLPSSIPFIWQIREASLQPPFARHWYGDTRLMP